MSLSILVRVIPELLREGRVAGQAEVVETGQSVVFRDAEEVIGFIRLVGAGAPGDVPRDPVEGAASVAADLSGSASP